MRHQTFRARLSQIEAFGFSIVSLSEIVRRLKANESIQNLLVITVDDGWTGFVRFAAPALAERGWPTTLYLTTYYAVHGRPVLNVLRSYLRWKGLSLPTPNKDDKSNFEDLMATALLHDIDLRCEDGRLFGLSSPGELAALCRQGLDLQLHTHRHRVPSNNADLANEIDTNRAIIERISGRSAPHLCYPSGEYRADQFEVLKDMGVQSATTTRLGLVSQHSNPMELPRLLDGENLSDIEFDAELSGFSSLVRQFLGKNVRV